MFAWWRRQHSWAWVAVCAVLLNALAPAISHAWAATRGIGTQGWAEVCRAEPAAAATGNDQATDASQSSQAQVHIEHCPFCLTHFGAAALPATGAADAALVGGPDLLPQLFLHAPRPLHAWAQAQARAPPSAS